MRKETIEGAVYIRDPFIPLVKCSSEKGRPILQSLKNRPGERKGEGWVMLPTFAREPPGLRANADAAAVLIVLRGPAQVIPGTLGADTT